MRRALLFWGAVLARPWWRAAVGAAGCSKATTSYTPNKRAEAGVAGVFFKIEKTHLGLLRLGGLPLGGAPMVASSRRGQKAEVLASGP